MAHVHEIARELQQTLDQARKQADELVANLKKRKELPLESRDPASFSAWAYGEASVGHGMPI